MKRTEPIQTRRPLMRGQSSLEFIVITSLLLGILHIPIIELSRNEMVSIWQWVARSLEQGHGFYFWVWRHAFLLPGSVL